MLQGSKTDEILQSMPRRQFSNRLVRGIGLNDSAFCIGAKISGRVTMHRAYSAWCEMLKRCYSKRFHEIQPTYIGCSVDNEWHTFSGFYQWWAKNHADGMHLDKDILVIGNKIYGRDYCVYVPRKVNGLISIPSARGYTGYIGVGFREDSGRFIAIGKRPNGGQYQIGSFSDPKAAHMAWLDNKLGLAKEYKIECDKIRGDLYTCLVSKIMSYKQF